MIMMLILAVVVALFAFLGRVLENLVTTDIDRSLPQIARWIVRRYAACMPPDVREDMEPEWLGEVEAIVSHFGKLGFALKLCISREDLVRAHREPKVRGRGNVTIKLTGVSATGSVGDLDPGKPDVRSHIATGGVQLSGQAAIVITAVGTVAGTSSAQGFSPGSLVASTQIFPPSITMTPSSGKKDG